MTAFKEIISFLLFVTSCARTAAGSKAQAVEEHQSHHGNLRPKHADARDIHTKRQLHPELSTLDELITMALSMMPRKNSELYHEPDLTAMTDWELTVLGMMEGCVGNLPASLSSYEMWTLTEDAVDYCILATFQDDDNDGYVDDPWGTVIVNQASNSKPLSIDIPHPLNDANTAKQGIAVFKGTNAASYTLSGSHRYANSQTSSCDAGYKTADAAHTINAFYASAKAIMEYYDGLGLDHTAIQFHGMSDTSCPGVGAYFTHGVNVAPQPSAKIDLLRNAFNQSIYNSADADYFTESFTRVFVVPGDATSCGLTGTNNIQGRLLNGVAPDSVCDGDAFSYTGKFIHIEQTSEMRSSSAYQHWIDAINSVDFADASPPPPPVVVAVLSPNGGEVIEKGSEVPVTWSLSGISGNVKLSVHENNESKDYIRTIANDAANTGSYLWQVPTSSSFNPSENYVVRVRSVENISIKDYSDSPFTLVEPPPPFTILTPNGGENIEKGSEYMVTWNSYGITGNVKLSVNENNEGKDYIRTIVDSTPNTGSFLWEVPTSSSFNPSDNYVVRVRSVEDISIKDYSDGPFTLVEPPPPFIILSPNGGESIEKGSSYTVTWNSHGITGNVKLSVHVNDASKTYARTIVNETPNTGSFLWEVPTSNYFATSDNYVVRIRSVDDTSIKDYSDNSFSIVAAS